jgi:hypothetical protein
MIRYLLVLAVTGGSLLIADMVLGFIAASEVPGRHAVGRDVHWFFSLLTVLMLLGIHSIVYTYFMATARWAKEVVQVYQLPDWYVAQAKRNKRRAFRFVMGSMTTIAIAAWLGGAADTLGTAYSAWHLAAAALAVAFNFGSFVVEYAAISGHARLLAELKDEADRLREERYGTQAVTEVEDRRTEPAPTESPL